MQHEAVDLAPLVIEESASGVVGQREAEIYNQDLADTGQHDSASKSVVSRCLGRSRGGRPPLGIGCIRPAIYTPFFREAVALGRADLSLVMLSPSVSILFFNLYKTVYASQKETFVF